LNAALRGTVRSWAEKQEAERSAWAAPGVTSVDNKIIVSPYIFAEPSTMLSALTACCRGRRVYAKATRPQEQYKMAIWNRRD
jgi:hypothetical protein